ncbi:coiled-coil domain-containing protein 63-like isoform X2 [Engystomops pustulosus]
MAVMSFRKESEQNITSQQKKINVLREQQKELKLAILFSGSKRIQLEDQENAKKMYELTNALDKYNQLIEEKKSCISDLVMKIREKEDEIVNQKKAISNAKILRQSTIDHLENQILLVSQRFNVLNAENETLKTGIEHLRFNKKEFLKLIGKIQQKISHQKATMEKIQEQIMSLHEEKHVVQAESLSFQEITDKVMKKVDVKIEELSRYIDHLKKQQKFNEARSFDRYAITRELEQKKREKELERTKKYKKDVSDRYNRMCEDLGNFFGWQDVNLYMMADQYQLDDMKNFSLFTFINELNWEMETIRKEIKATEDEMSLLEICNKNSVSEQIRCKKELEENLEKTLKLADRYQSKEMELRRDHELITSALQNVVKNLNCDLSKMTGLLRVDGLTSKLMYFKILKTKIKEIMQILQFCAVRDIVEGSISSTSIAIFENIDSLFEESDISYSKTPDRFIIPSMPKKIKFTDDPVEILTFEQLKRKVLKGVSCKTEKAKRKIQTYII